MSETFLERLRERKLVRWAGAYLAAAWVAFEVADVVGGRLGWPDGFYRGYLVLLVAGFFQALVLAWYHGERGRQRVGGVEALVLTVLTVIGLGGAWLAWARSPSGDVPASIEAVAGDRAAGQSVGEAAEVAPATGTVAVLAFDDLSESGDQAFFAEGMAEEIRGVLSRLPGLRVAARTSSFSFKGTDTDIREIGRRLVVRHVLEGSVRREGDLVRISAQLIDAGDGFQIWSRSFTRELRNVIELQQDIAREVASELLPQLGELPVPEVRQAVPEAHVAYLRGLHAWHRVDTEVAVAGFQEAIRHDSTLAGAWAGLGATLTVIALQDPSMRDRAIAAVDRAIALDPRSPDALAAKARADLVFRYDWDAAEEGLERALALDPSHVETRHWYSHVLEWTGRNDQAVAQAREALRLDPLSPFMNLNMGNALKSAGRMDEAVSQIEQAVELAPEFSLAYMWLWDARMAAGDVDGATEALVRWATLAGTSQEAARRVGEAIAEHGRTGTPVALDSSVIEAVGALSTFTRRMYGRLGQHDRVMELLLEADAARTGDYDLLSVKYGNVYPGLRGDSRYEALVERVGPH